MQVSRDLISGPPSVVDLFICMFCERLVKPRQWLVHDGGYLQHFCQQAVCVECLFDKIQVDQRRLVGALPSRVVPCPNQSKRLCSQPLQPMMLRSPSPCNLVLYRDIDITCRSCLMNFNPFDYVKHECKKKCSNELSFVDYQGPLLDHPDSDADELYRKNVMVACSGGPSSTGEGNGISSVIMGAFEFDLGLIKFIFGFICID